MNEILDKVCDVTNHCPRCEELARENQRLRMLVGSVLAKLRKIGTDALASDADFTAELVKIVRGI